MSSNLLLATSACVRASYVSTVSRSYHNMNALSLRHSKDNEERTLTGLENNKKDF